MSPVFRRLRWSILLTSLFTLCPLANADTKSITVIDPRPVAEAVEQLESIYGLPITYEDPIYVHVSTLVDVTDRVRRDQQLGVPPNGRNADRVLVPKGGAVSFKYEVPSAGASPGGGLRQSEADRKTAASQAIWNALRSYVDPQEGEMFTVVEDNRTFHVVPTHFINADGTPQQLTPLLDAKVTILPKQRTAADLVGEICQSLSLNSGQTVIEGIMPSSLLVRHNTTIAGSGLTARYLLSRLLAEVTIPLSWQLFYDPDLHVYVLNIHTVMWKNNQ